jgi:hypothetical protein
MTVTPDRPGIIFMTGSSREGGAEGAKRLYFLRIV